LPGPSYTEDDSDDDEDEEDEKTSPKYFISIISNDFVSNVSPTVFIPGNLTIEEGSTVVWVNNDASICELISSTSSSVDFPEEGQVIEPYGGSFEYESDDKGTLDYFCAVHPEITGRIIVE
jgi:plastocyanin